MNVLVTGGTGFIGSHTVVELQQQGHTVYIIDDLSNSQKNVLASIEQITGILPEFHQFDLCDAKKTKEFFNTHSDIDAVIHFAAHKYVPESVSKPLKYYKNNLLSLINILQCMNDNSVPYFVFSSSCTIYGQPEILPVTESSPIQKAYSPYGNTKQVCEDIIEDTVLSRDIAKAICLRYFNPAGAHKSALIGELPNGVPTNLVPFITQTAIGKREILQVYGNDYNTADGSCLRDYIHVVDLAKAHIKALERLQNKESNNYEVYNLGTGTPNSVLEVVRSFEKVSGQKLNYKIVDRRPGDIEKIWAKTKLANEQLNWKTEMNLDEMLSSAWNWEMALAKK